MLTVGVDLAAEAARTAVALLRWRPDRVDVEGLVLDADDVRVLDAVRVAEVRRRVERGFAAPFTTVHGLVRLGISVGTALGGPGATPQSLLAAADRHMYGVKSRRRARRTRRAPVG